MYRYYTILIYQSLISFLQWPFQEPKLEVRTIWYLPYIYIYIYIYTHTYIYIYIHMLFVHISYIHMYMSVYMNLPSGNLNVAIEHGQLWWIYPWNMVIFHSYVNVYQRVKLKRKGRQPASCRNTSSALLPSDFRQQLRKR